MHIIETSNPSVPGGFTVAYHKDMGPFDIENLEKWLEVSPDTKLPWPYPKTCADVREWVEQATGVINACVLDYALTHPELMPILWDLGNPVAAYGTIYADADGALHVKAIEYRGGNIPPEGRMEPICWAKPIPQNAWEPGMEPSHIPLFCPIENKKEAGEWWRRIEKRNKLMSGWEAKFEKPLLRYKRRCGVW